MQKKQKTVKFIDLFAGIGGTRIGFESACQEKGLKPSCVFTSEIKDHAVRAYKNNFRDKEVYGDINRIPSKNIPDFDFLLAGFPCQPFSSAGARRGFMDTRGTLFFEIERILKDKKPYGFLLENVEGLVNHDKENRSDPTGRTLSTILSHLKDLGYKVSWKLVDSSNYGIPQVRKRVYITGTRKEYVDLDNFQRSQKFIKDILEKNKPVLKTQFTEKLFRHYSSDELHGKAIKDKRGGSDNIHSWDIELKGKTTKKQRELLNTLLKERRKKHWAEKKGIKWMDGMPLTLGEIHTFFDCVSKKELKKMLDDLVEKKYVRYEHPKDMHEFETKNGIEKTRKHALHVEKGYNIVAGKLSFEVSKILDPNHFSPTLVATDVSKIAIVDGQGIRRLTIREGLRLFGFPKSYKLDVGYEEAFDLLGNTVVVNIIKMVSERLIKNF